MIANSINEIEANLVAASNMDWDRFYIGQPRLTKTENGINYWVQKIDRYPLIRLAHFTRLRWPSKVGFQTVESIAKEILITSGLASTKYLHRSSNTEWHWFLSSDTLSVGEPIAAFKVWLKKTSVKERTIKQVIKRNNHKGFPDFIDFDTKKNCLVAWEVKAPFDQVQKHQTSTLQDLSKLLKVEVNILSFEFD